MIWLVEGYIQSITFVLFKCIPWISPLDSTRRVFDVSNLSTSIQCYYCLLTFEFSKIINPFSWVAHFHNKLGDFNKTWSDVYLSIHNENNKRSIWTPWTIKIDLELIKSESLGRSLCFYLALSSLFKFQTTGKVNLLMSISYTHSLLYQQPIFRSIIWSTFNPKWFFYSKCLMR